MDIRKIKYFLAVVECGSFTKAASKCYVSQTTMSQQIATMEQELGFQLFDRSGYRSRLTLSGESFYASSRKIVEEYNHAVHAAKLLSNSNRENLKIGISGPIEKKVLPPILRLFLELYPNVDIEIVEDSFSQLTKKLEDKSLDIIFGLANDMEKIKKFECHFLFKNTMIVITAINHPWSHFTEVYGNDLKTEKLIVFSKNYSFQYYQAVIESCRKDGFEPNIVKEVDSFDEMLLLVSINKGVAIISDEAMTEIEGVHKLILNDTHHHAEYCVARNTQNEKEIVEKFIRTIIKKIVK